MSTDRNADRSRTGADGKGSIDRRTLLTGTASAAGLVGAGLPISSRAQTSILSGKVSRILKIA